MTRDALILKLKKLSSLVQYYCEDLERCTALIVPVGGAIILFVAVMFQPPVSRGELRALEWQMETQSQGLDAFIQEAEGCLKLAIQAPPNTAEILAITEMSLGKAESSLANLQSQIAQLEANCKKLKLYDADQDLSYHQRQISDTTSHVSIAKAKIAICRRQTAEIAKRK